MCHAGLSACLSRDHEFVKRKMKELRLHRFKHHRHHKLLSSILKTFTMLRTAILRAARSASYQVARRSSPIGRPIAISYTSLSTRLAPATFQISRCYSAASGLSKPEVEGRIVDLLKNFDKVRSLAWHEH